ncbi:MAG: hypothetical protein ACK501_24560 [Planctomycetota bacterium]
MNIPPGMQLAFHGKVEDVREIARLLTSHGLPSATGAMPGGG